MATVPQIRLRDAIGVFLVLAFVFALGVLFWKAIPRENEQLIVYMLGQLSGFVSGIVAYHYVTKAGEKELEQQRAKNTERAFEAVGHALQSTPKTGDEAGDAAHDVADAAVEQAEEISPSKRRKK